MKSISWRVRIIPIFSVIALAPHFATAETGTIPRIDSTLNSAASAGMRDRHVMILDASVINAAVEDRPLILFKIMSIEEQGEGSRSAKTQYEIEILAESGAEKFKKGKAWRFGHGWPSEGYHLALPKGSWLGQVESFPAGSESEARSRFSTLDSLLTGHAGKLMNPDAFDLACKGKGEIVLAKLGTPVDPATGKASIEILENISGATKGAHQVSFPDSQAFEPGVLFFALYQKSLIGKKLSMARKTTVTDSKELSKLYASRLDFLKRRRKASQ